MKVTVKWLKQYVDFDWSVEELADRLTMLGLEVEGIQKIGGEFEGVVVAQVITRERHPNADKLSLCRVNDGKGERQIVCGAQNFKAGDKVPLILPGSSLPPRDGAAPVTIKVGKIRSCESQGMLCSPQELGLPDQVDGLLILPEDAPVGRPFAEFLGRAPGDVVLDLEITPNRPDLNSVIGIAREISAVTGNPLRLPPIGELKQSQPADSAKTVSVRIEDATLCPRYVARVVRGVKIGPSPDWLRSLLEKVGIRSISNVVDVTNFVMMETGQPLHAFDYHLLAASPGSANPAIVVRPARANETFTTLDGQKRTLTEQALLIADETKPVALAGVMGGQNSEINSATADVLIESACFNPQNIRATSRKLDLRTESSYRFERGADVGICDWASRRAAQLILETAGGELEAAVVDSWPGQSAPRRVSLRHGRAAAVLGVEIPFAQQRELLKRLEIEPEGEISQGEAATVFRIPSFRVDLKREIDLVEEIVRLYGIDRVPATPPRGALGSHAFDATHDELSEARRILCGLGLNETQGQTLISGQSAKAFADEAAVTLANPLSSDMDVLRPSLLPGLLDALKHNVHHRNLDLSFFELGRVFSQQPAGANPAARVSKGKDGRAGSPFREARHLAIALTGKREPLFWTGEEREARYSLYDLKGILEEFFDRFGLRGITWTRCEGMNGRFVESGEIHLGKFSVGQIGQLLPTLAREYDLRDPVLLAELDLEALLPRRNTSKTLKALPHLPSIRRDIAMLVPEATTHEAVLQVARQAKVPNLESIDLFDVFRGKNVPTGQKSVAYAFTYRGADRNLTDAEVNAAHEQLVKLLQQNLAAVVR